MLKLNNRLNQIVSGGHGFRRTAFNNTDTLGVLVSLYSADIPACHTFAVSVIEYDRENKQVKSCVSDQPAYHYNSQRF